MSFLGKQEHEYAPVADEEAESTRPTSHVRDHTTYFKLVTVFCLLVALVSTTIGGFFAGRLYATRPAHHRHSRVCPEEQSVVHCKSLFILAAASGCFKFTNIKKWIL